MSTNGAGFLQPGGLQIPYTPSAQDYVVVVLGGSVAARAVLGYEGGEPLVDALRALPEFSKRRPVVINMAQGSGKQPQQLLELAYLLAIGQHIDLALNIDGFNEFALGQANINARISPMLPSWEIMSAIAKELYPTPESADYYAAAYRILAARKSVASHLRIASAERTGTSYAWHMLLAARAQAVLATATAEYEALIKSDPSNTKARLGLDLPPNDKVGPTEDIYDLWLKCSQQMRALAAANKFKYLHIIQPNQQFSKHQFFDKERKIALSLPPNHPYVAGTKKGYFMLVQRADQLSRNGIVSLIDIFDNVHEEIYGDRCCHFNRRGETLFAKAVAREVAATLDR